MGNRWVMYMTRRSGEIATDPRLPLITRIDYLVVARAKPGGHCQFGKDEVASKLLRLNRKTGELSRYTRQNLNAALREGVEIGLFAPGSTLECIVMPFDRIEIRGQIPARPCPVHGDNLSWIGDSWVDTAELVAGRNSTRELARQAEGIRQHAELPKAA